jgi:hypothetical protein
MQTALGGVMVVAALAACTSMQLPSQTDVVTEPISCDMSIGDYCSTHACATTLDSARADSSLCPRVEMSCNGYVVLHGTAADGESNWWFANGAFVAYEPSTIAGQTCAAGPATFERPRCDFSIAIPVDSCN